MLGQEIRLSKLVSQNKNCVIAALDAGGFFGPYPGLLNISEVCKALQDSDAILIEPGSIEVCRETFLEDDPPILITRLNWNTDYCFQWGYNKSRIVKSLSPGHALAMGADVGVASLSIGTGSEEIDADNISVFTGIIEEAMKSGLPVIGEIYPPRKEYAEGDFDDLIYKSCRIAAELGANAIKTFYTGKNFKQLTQSLPVPVFALGGDKKDSDLDSLKQAEDSVKNGAKGVVFGRNLYQSKLPGDFLFALKEVVNLRLDSVAAAKKFGLMQ